MKLRLLLMLALAFTLVVGLGTTHAAPIDDEEMERLHQKLEKLQAKLAALETADSREEATSDEESPGDASEAESVAETEATELERLKAEIAELESKVAELENQQDEPEQVERPAGNTRGQHRDFIEEGTFEKSVAIPGTTLAFAFGGYAKVDYIQDFDAIGDRSEFRVGAIPIEGTPEAAQSGGTTLQARETRFNIDVRSLTPVGQFRAYFEGDFFGAGNAFRLRHGYGLLGHFLAGQTWSTFMDIDTVPETLDFEAPEASVLLRRAMIRWQQAAEPLQWGIAIEDPSPQIENPSSLDVGPRAAMPDIVSRVKWIPESGRFVTLAGMVRQIRWDGGEGVASPRKAGWGLNFAGSWRVASNDSVIWQAAFGRGFGQYLEGVSGFDADAVLTPDGELQLVSAQGYIFGYLRYWTPSLRSTLTLSYARLDNQSAQSDDAIKELRSPHFNLIWSPWQLVDVGGEIMWGERINKDGGSGTATRFQFSVKFKFN